METRPRPKHHGARPPIVCGIVALVLTLGPTGPSAVLAQEAAPSRKATDRKETSVPPAAALRLQKLATRRARAEYEVARLNREIAEIAVREYAEGTFASDLATAEGELKLAESDLIRAEDRADWARRMFDKGYVSKATGASEQLKLEKARCALEQAQARKKILVDYTRAKTMKSLEADVERARKEELDKREAWERAVIRQAEMEIQLDRT